MTKYMRGAAVAAIILGCVSCGDVVRQGRAPVLLTVASLTPTTLNSDVVKLLTSPAPCSTTSPCPTIVNDTASAALTLQMKDVNIAPTANNQVTINRYHVQYTRADGRSQEGVDVPYGFDGAVTATISPNATTTVPFELVRHLAKESSPLVQLETNANIIATIAIITFYGNDAVGNAIQAQGSMTVNFGNFADQ